MPKATRDLTAFEKRLRSLSNIKVTAKTVPSAQFDKAALAAQRLQQQQQKLAVQAQELANRQERARQATERLAQAQAKLGRAQERQQKVSSSFDKKLADNARAAESLQRQRSAGIIKQLREQEKAAERAAKAFRDRFSTLGGIFERLGQGIASFGSRITVALTAPLAALGAIAVRSAVGLDAQVNTLRAFTGSAEAAERRLSGLITTAQKTPGLTTELGLLLDSQLRLANVTVETIDKVTPAIGRLNAVQKLQDPGRFAQNLVQLVTQNFERIDLKELVGQSPIAGQIIKEMFNVDSPINAEAIRESAQRMGLTTTDAFFTAFAEAASRNAALANVTESMATQFAKLVDRITLAFRPLGVAIVDAFIPIVNLLVPIIEVVGRGFAALPGPIQTLVVLFGALTAAVGPTVFILGNLVSTVGSLVTAYAQLVALGLTPTIKGFQLLTQVMRGNASLMAGQAATTAAAAGGWIALAGGIGLAVAAIAIVAVAIGGFVSKQKESVKIGAEQLASTKAQIDSLRSQVRFIDGLTAGVDRTATQQARLNEIYKSLNKDAGIRVEGIQDETQRLAAIREELEKLINLRIEERRQQAAALAGALADTLAGIDAKEREIEANTAVIRSNSELLDIIDKTGELTAEQAKRFADTGRSVEFFRNQSEELVKQNNELRGKIEELNKTASEHGQILEQLTKEGDLSARGMLVLAKSMGTFRGNIEQTLPAFERFIASQERAKKSTDIFTESLRKQNDELLRAGKGADEAAKQRNDIIRAAVSLAREATDSFDGALKTLKAFIAANPDLRAAIEKERQLAGKSFEDFVVDLLGGRPGSKADKAGTSLRNAQEQLAKSLEDVAAASSERIRSIERDKNEALLQENENLFRLQLIAYRQYLHERALLTSKNLQIEIREQEQIVTAALAEQQRLLERSRKPGVPESERTSALAGAAEAEARALAAGTRILDLRAQQQRINIELTQALAEAHIEQEKTVRQLGIEFAELDGKSEDALNTATIERFREQLEVLGKSQDDLNKRLKIAREIGDGEGIERLQTALRLNQSQIDLIELIKESEFATNKLAAANEFVRRAKERQAELERQIAFEVEFRGLTEEEAIAKRLDGERKLADSLRVVRDLIQAEVDLLNAKKVNVPQALIEFLTEVNGAIESLGKLPFAEQFRLVQKEFDRLNDERIQKIQDVERAVRNRDIAEVEGAIIIRRINGQYVGDLEKQLEILKQIAKASKDRTLQQQAETTGETVKDAKDEVASLGQQIISTGKDAARSGFADFFRSILNRTADVKTALFDLLDSVVERINDVIAENLAQSLFESLFGGADDAGGGLFGKVGRFFGLGGAETVAKTTETAAATAALTTGATTAGAALTTGGAAAATALTTGGATAGTTLLSSVTAAATAFAATISAAGAAFAAAIGASAGSQALGGLGSAIGGAATGLFPAVPGGVYKVVEGGYPEAVLTTDPKYATQQFEILKHYLRQTRGLFGRIPDYAIPRFETGGFISARQTEMNLLSSISRSPSSISALPQAALASAGGNRARGLRIILVKDMREVRDYLNSAEGEQVIVERLGRNSTFKSMIRG